MTRRPVFMGGLSALEIFDRMRFPLITMRFEKEFNPTYMHVLSTRQLVSIEIDDES